jgi:hypothetical protein
MAGQADFTPDEWVTMRGALMSAGIVVALSEGGGDDMLSEVFAITQRGAATPTSSCASWRRWRTSRPACGPA